MFLLKSVAIIALLVVPIRLPSEPPPESFLIHVVEPSRRPDLQAHYFLTGDFGGIGAYQVKPFGEDGLLISTEYQRKKANTLRAVLYSPGCALQLIRIENLQTAAREIEFVCHPLARIRLKAKIDLAEVSGSRDWEVRAYYVAPWSHTFFGIADGAVMTLDAGTSMVFPDGSFMIDLPGFANDPISSSLCADAYFSLTIRVKTTGNLVALLQADAPLSATPNGDLTLERTYAAPVHFQARPINDSPPK